MSRRAHFQVGAGQAVMTYGEPKRARMTDPRDPAFHSEPSAHHDAHGFVRDNTSTSRDAYELGRNDELWDTHATTRKLRPGDLLHTLQGEGETARPSNRPPGTGGPPRVLRVRGKDVLVDGHHRVARARVQGKALEVQHLDAAHPAVEPFRGRL